MRTWFLRGAAFAAGVLVVLMAINHPVRALRGILVGAAVVLIAAAIVRITATGS